MFEMCVFFEFQGRNWLKSNNVKPSSSLEIISIKCNAKETTLTADTTTYNMLTTTYNMLTRYSSSTGLKPEMKTDEEEDILSRYREDIHCILDPTGHSLESTLALEQGFLRNFYVVHRIEQPSTEEQDLKAMRAPIKVSLSSQLTGRRNKSTRIHDFGWRESKLAIATTIYFQSKENG